MTKRNLNADLIRCVAVFSVISVHFLLNGGFYKQEVRGIPMLVIDRKSTRLNSSH